MDSNPDTKVKKTRRRLRLSCTACVQRRQKCDRKFPCGLCVSRGVSHLCKWESVPVARIPPQRPPHVGKTPPTDSERQVNELNARIAYLEESLTACQLKLQNPLLPTGESHLLQFPTDLHQIINWSDHLESPSSNSPSCFSSDSLEDDNDRPCTIVPFSHATYATSLALVQLSLGYSDEYAGRGTILHGLDVINKTSPSTPPPGRLSVRCSASNSSQKLIQFVLPLVSTLHLVDRFLESFNWRFRLPSDWLRVFASDICAIAHNQTREPLNPSALALLFAIFALVPHTDDNGETSEHYLLCSIAALRISASNPSLIPSSSAVDCVLVGCLAAPLICSYLADHQRVSDAWKLAGDWVRLAQSIGLHCGQANQSWDVNEIDLRRRAWLALVNCDVVLSFALGRPTITRSDVSSIGLYHQTADLQRQFDAALLSLLRLGAAVIEHVHYGEREQQPYGMPVFDLDAQFSQWEASLSPALSIMSPSDCPPVDPAALTIFRQRVQLTTYYLMFRMKLHLSFVTNEMEIRRTGLMGSNRSRTTCMASAMDLIRLHAVTLPKHNHSDAATFESGWPLLDAAVTLLCVIRLHPWRDRPRDAGDLVQLAIEAFQQKVPFSANSPSSLPNVAVTLLTMLLQDAIPTNTHGPNPVSFEGGFQVGTSGSFAWNVSPATGGHSLM